MWYSEARGTLIYEKNLKSKISCQTPFNKKYKSSANIKRYWCDHLKLDGRLGSFNLLMNISHFLNSILKRHDHKMSIKSEPSGLTDLCSTRWEMTARKLTLVCCQCFRSGSGLGSESFGSVDPDLNWESGSNPDPGWQTKKKIIFLKSLNWGV